MVYVPTVGEVNRLIAPFRVKDVLVFCDEQGRYRIISVYDYDPLSNIQYKFRLYQVNGHDLEVVYPFTDTYEVGEFYKINGEWLMLVCRNGGLMMIVNKVQYARYLGYKLRRLRMEEKNREAAKNI